MRELTEYEANDLAFSLDEAWADPRIPEEQGKISARELEDWHAGRIAEDSTHPYAILRQMMRDVVAVVPHPSVLEVGCSSGYNAEVLESCGAHEYAGVDYSAAFIEVAKKQRQLPQLFDLGNPFSLRKRMFYCADARSLPTQTRFSSGFDLVIDGCVLIHVAEWQDVLREQIRCSRKLVALHRTPYCIGEAQRRRVFLTEAYGVECLRFHYSMTELYTFMREHGMRRVKTYVIDRSGDYEMNTTLWYKVDTE